MSDCVQTVECKKLKHRVDKKLNSTEIHYTLPRKNYQTPYSDALTQMALLSQYTCKDGGRNSGHWEHYRGGQNSRAVTFLSGVTVPLGVE